MGYEPSGHIHLPPLQVAPETFLLRSAQPAIGAPLSVALNSLVIRGAEPVIVDTGTRANHDHWLDDVTSLVDPADVRWIFLSHDDDDHTGNLAEALDLCPQATLVANWAATERMGGSFAVPPGRMRWVDAGGTLDAGDRVLRAVSVPVYDSPSTRGLYDPATGVLWASDAFATPMPADPVDRVEDVPPPMWAEGMAMFHHHALCPWLAIVDRDAYADQVQRLRALDPAVIVAAHTPVIAGDSRAVAFDHLAALPDVTPPPHPDQQVLDALAGSVPA
ncbi:MAG TPA: MBL fold metallo-hydrolase [Acidimicrobiales bacterium]